MAQMRMTNFLRRECSDQASPACSGASKSQRGPGAPSPACQPASESQQNGSPNPTQVPRGTKTNKKSKKAIRAEKNGSVNALNSHESVKSKLIPL